MGPHLEELLGNEKPEAVPIMVDNRGAIALAKKDAWNQRTRHINVRYQYVQEAVRNKQVVSGYVASKEQLADGFTKTLRAEKLEACLAWARLERA